MTFRNTVMTATARAQARGSLIVSRKPSIAFTLVEVLVALTLTGLVLTLAGRIAVQTITVQNTVEDALHRRARQDFVFDRLAVDLRARSADADLVLRLDANHRPLVEWGALVSSPGSALHTERTPATVRYRLMRVADDRLTMVRELRTALQRAPAPVTTTVARNLAQVRVSIFDGRAWSPLTAASRKRKTRPQAFELACRWAADDKWVRRTYLCASADEIRSQRDRRK